ncbi:hypothetical protein NDU88_002394 [Pleurodeles waltl]|uniref:Uncharacterized protein n=1 Tax=Pleurodeles waltl TaxID=8319 RepID=A0AAV7W2W8_PLEWA|nr:hypothetical protein NDU88_002394 [Pleurodeles waltl]
MVLTPGPPVPQGAPGRQGRLPLLLSPGARLSIPISGLQRAEPLQLLLSPSGLQLRSASLLESPAPAEGQAAGSGVRRLGPDLCNRAQTGLRGSLPGTPGSPPPLQHRLPWGRLVIFGLLQAPPERRDYACAIFGTLATPMNK